MTTTPEQMKKNAAVFLQRHPEYRKQYYKSNREHVLKRQNTRYRETKERVIDHYSNNNPVCARCGFDDITALCLHHTNGDGNEYRNGRSGVPVYRKLEKEGFPDQKLEVLCANCHIIKHTSGGD